MVGDRQARRRGLARAAICLMLRHVATFIGDRHVRAIVRSENVACIRLLESLGFSDRGSDSSGDISFVLDDRALSTLLRSHSPAYIDNNLCARLTQSALDYVAELNK